MKRTLPPKKLLVWAPKRVCLVKLLTPDQSAEGSLYCKCVELVGLKKSFICIRFFGSRRASGGVGFGNFTKWPGNKPMILMEFPYIILMRLVCQVLSISINHQPIPGESTLIPAKPRWYWVNQGAVEDVNFHDFLTQWWPNYSKKTKNLIQENTRTFQLFRLCDEPYPIDIVL